MWIGIDLRPGFFYILGSTGITNFMGNKAGEIFRSLGTGSRFTSIERGVLDLRDIAYYGSLSIFFLMLNVVSLDRKRWSHGSNTVGYRRMILVATILIALNLLAANVLLHKVNFLRMDLTENQEYSLSRTSRDLIANLSEPLILRGYFSEKTHPLLSPLVPRIKDLMQEYAIASSGKVDVEFVDPKFDQEAEAEANQQYGIKPVPFQIAGRYEASVVNSYFDILIKYGDQHVTLGFNDIIEIEPRNDGQLDVRLRNLEYDLTKSIKKTVYGFQSIATVFEKIKDPILLTAIVTADALPEALNELPGHISKVAESLTKEADGKLKFEVIDPGQDPQKRQQVNSMFDVTPISVSFFSQDTFYLYLILDMGSTKERIFISPDMGEAEIRSEIEATLKRSSSGFLKTVGIWTPPSDIPPQMAMMQRTPPDKYQAIRQVLPENYNLENVDLKSGRVPGNIDILLVVAPQGMTDLDRFAIDQYLMRGGAVAVLSGNYILDLNPYAQSLNVKKTSENLNDMLTSYGVIIGDSLVMDQQNEPFPIPVTRKLGGFTVQEIKHIDYPFFVDIRKSGMDNDSPVVSSLPAVTMNWVSPILVKQDEKSGRKTIELLKSSPNSWLYTGTDIQPNFRQYPQKGFAPGSDMKSQVLAVSVQGTFSSYFTDRPDPRQEEKEKNKAADGEDLPGADPQSEPTTDDILPDTPIIKKSPEASRLIVVGSSEFINDTVISISQSMGQERFLNSLGFLQNIIDWTLEDEDLLVIRSRGSHARILEPISREEQTFWEWFNYAVAILSLLVEYDGKLSLERIMNLTGLSESTITGSIIKARKIATHSEYCVVFDKQKGVITLTKEF